MPKIYPRKKRTAKKHGAMCRFLSKWGVFMTRSTKAAIIGLLVVLIVAAVAFVWYLAQPQTLVDTDTLLVVRDGSTITVHDLVADEVYNTFRIVRVRRSEGVTESHTAIDTATISIDTIPHGGLKIIDKTSRTVYIVKRKCVSMNP